MTKHVFQRLIPYPFNALCLGDPLSEGEKAEFQGINAPIMDVKNVSNLSSTNEQNAPLLMGKSLLTTRKWELDDLFSKHRKESKPKGKTRRNLRREDKQRIARGLHATSIIDLLYRMRVRSNYDDPEMFIYGKLSSKTATAHYRNLQSLVESIFILFENIIEKKVGANKLQILKQRFDRC